MEYSEYLRDQAAEYRRLAESANDPTKKEDLFESRRFTRWWRTTSTIDAPQGDPRLNLQSTARRTIQCD
jgi:hypothetical protein